MDSRQSDEAEATTWHRRPELLLIALIALLYVTLIGRYRAFDLDNVWYLSYTHTFWVRHLETDTFMRLRFPFGMGGVLAFGKLAAAIQGAVLSHLGWTLTSATLISIAFVVSALLLLADMCRRLGHGTGFTLCFVALVGLTEPFVETSQKSRYEFLPVFLLALALWLVSRRYLAVAMFVAALAAEVEPAAIVVPCTVAIALLHQLLTGTPGPHRSPRVLWLTVLRILLAAAAAALVYYLLHPDIFSILHSANFGTVQAGLVPGGFFTAYYIRVHRHLPELLLLVAALGVSLVARRQLLLDWPALCLLGGLLVSTLLRWGNPACFVFVSPFVCLFIVQALYAPPRRRWMLGAVLLLTLPQYIYRYYFWASRHAGFSQGEQRLVGEAITRTAVLLGKPPQQLEILGNYNLWFAHPNHFTDLDQRVFSRTVLNHTDLIVCFDEPVDPLLKGMDNPEIPCRALDVFSTGPVETLDLHGNRVELRLPRPQS